MRTIAAFVAFVFILLIGGGLAVSFFASSLNGPGPLDHRKNLIVPKGVSVSAIGRELEREKVVSSRTLFLFRHWLDGKPPLRAGEYQFRPHITLREIVAMMSKGNVVVRKFSMPEGRSSAEVIAALAQEPALTGEVPPVPPEGSLAPDTYRFFHGDTRKKLADQMQRDMRELVDSAWIQRTPGLPYQTPRELVVMASIIEKETGVADERARVAGVFVNRLKKGMPLQSDPTVIYGITLGKQPLGRALTYADLDKPTPYNTYQIRGMPPGPICNPGKASLLAAANPEIHNYLYFVADGYGGHKFAATLDEHERNVIAYRKIMKRRKEAGEK